MNVKKYDYLVPIAFLIISIIVSFITKSTYEEGDSINHYFYSKYAWKHPHLFLDYWGKPLFILLSAPFAWFGWAGMTLFNILVVFFSAILTWLTAKKLNIKYPVLAVLLCYFTPKYFLMQFSGLTELLFGLLLIAPVYFWVAEKKITALIILSFIPYSRSEGMIICIVWFVYLLISSNYKYLPLVLTGTVLYGIVGYFAKNNFLWYFTENIYATKPHNYGAGKWNHFIEFYPELTGIVFIVLWWIGWLFPLISAARIRQLFKDKQRLFEVVVIYGCVAAYFVSHSYFWYKGIWGSFGLIRVLVALTPLCALIALRGVNLLDYCIPAVAKKVYISIITVLVIAVPLLPSHGYSFDFKKDFEANFLQRVQTKATDYYKESLPPSTKFFTTALYVNVLLDLDPFDTTQTNWCHEYRNRMEVGNYMFWDSWYAVVESTVPFEQLTARDDLKFIRRFDYRDINADSTEYNVCIFQKIK